MAKQTTTVRTRISKAKKKRPGVHSKKKNSSNKKSKNYRKKYRSQGR
jgi:hypothetical protein